MSQPPHVASIGERDLIARIRDRARLTSPAVGLGIGDDAAILLPEAGTVCVITTDSLVEDVHFKRTWTKADAIGHKAVMVNLSDLAAMGAVPRGILLSLALPPALPLAEFDGLIDGVIHAAERAGAPLVGGNITRSPTALVIDVTAVGAARPRRVLRRGGAAPGDELYVTGELGAAAAGLGLLASGRDRDALDAAERGAVERYERPEARWQVGASIARTGAASAAIDLSDGLADAVARLAEASGLAAIVEADLVPIAPSARHWAERTGREAQRVALTGGEDYELAFSVKPRRRNAFLAAMRRFRGVPITRVGRFEKGRGAWLNSAGGSEPMPTGFTHF
jgi:thiamine-monophosphate kinase